MTAICSSRQLNNLVLIVDKATLRTHHHWHTSRHPCLGRHVSHGSVSRIFHLNIFACVLDANAESPFPINSFSETQRRSSHHHRRSTSHPSNYNSSDPHNTRRFSSSPYSTSSWPTSLGMGNHRATAGSSHNHTYSSKYLNIPSSSNNGQMTNWDRISSSKSLDAISGSCQTFSSVTNPEWISSNQSTLHTPDFEAQAWDDLFLCASNYSSTSTFGNPSYSVSLDEFAFPHRISPGLSPSPSPVLPDSFSVRPPEMLPSSSSSRRGSEDRPNSGKTCSHCHATSTPLWRREPETLKPLCNACGLYYQQRNKHRPQELIDADADEGDSSQESDGNYAGPKCSHCQTHRTSVWRRSKAGEQLCNACGVYARLRGKPRPLSLKKNKIKPRSKHISK